MENQKAIVFLSHSSKDKELLVPFRNALQDKTNGTIQFFLSTDGESIPFGHNWVASVTHSLEEAKLAFLLLTANSIGSSWVAFEAGFMHAKKIRVIPVALPGIDMGQIPPPIGLLQGFNLHSFGAMNNFFEILNEIFNHKHKQTFTDDDFQKMFGAKSSIGSGFFGEYSAFVRTIGLGEQNADTIPFTKSIRSQLEKQNIPFSDSGTRIEAAGVRIDFGTNGYYRMILHNEMASILMDSLCSIVAAHCSSPYKLEIALLDGVEPCGSDVELTVRANGSEFSVKPDNAFEFRGMNVRLGRAVVQCNSKGTFKPEDLRDLIMGLFRTGLLEFSPPKEMDPAFGRLTGAVNYLLKKQRRY